MDFGDEDINRLIELIKSSKYNGIVFGDSRCMFEAIADGKLDIIRFISIVFAKRYENICDVAAEYGQLEILKFLHENELGGCTTEAMDYAAAGGHVEIVKFLHENRQEGCTTEAMDGAAQYGFLDVIKFLHENRKEGCTTSAMDFAIQNGHVDVFKFLKSNRNEGCTPKGLECAIKGCHKDVILLMDNTTVKGVCDNSLMKLAAKSGMMDAVVVLYEKFGIKDCKNIINYACENSNIKMVKFLHDNHVGGCTKVAMGLAVKNGCFELVKFLHENRSEGCTPHAMTMAVESNHFNLVKFLYENIKNKWNFDDILRTCIRYNRVDVFEFIYNRMKSKYPYPTNILSMAIKCGSLEITKFLFEKHIYSYNDVDITEVASDGYWDVLMFLYDKNIKVFTPKIIDIAASSGQLNIIKFCHTNNIDGFTTNTFDVAAENGHIEIVKFLSLNRREGCTALAAIFASQNNHKDIIKFVVENHRNDCIENFDNALKYSFISDFYEAALNDVPDPDLNALKRFENYCMVCTDDIDIVKYLFETSRYVLHEYFIYCIIYDAIINNNKDIVELLKDSFDLGIRNNIKKWAFENSYGDVLQLILECEKYDYVTKCPDKIINWCIEKNKKDIFVALYKNYNVEYIDWAAENGHLDFLIFLSESLGEKCTYNSIVKAAGKGYSDIVEYLFHNRIECTLDYAVDCAIDSASKNINLNIVKFLLDSTGRHFDIKVWLRQWVEDNEMAFSYEFLDKLGSTPTVYTKQEDLEFIYILHEREFINSNQPIYKIGMSNDAKIRADSLPSRSGGYPKHSRYLYLHDVGVSNSRTIETIIKKVLAEKFKLRADIGSEYFEGDKYKIIECVSKICNGLPFDYLS